MSNLFLRTFKHMTQNHHIQDDCLIAKHKMIKVQERLNIQPKYCKFRDDIEESVRFKNNLQCRTNSRNGGYVFFLSKGWMDEELPKAQEYNAAFTMIFLQP